MSKKLLAVLGLLVVLSMLLVACGGNEVVENNTTDTTTDDTNTGETTTEETEEPDTTTEEPVATEEPEPTEEPVVRTTRVGGWVDTISMSVVDAASAVTQIEAGAADLYGSNLGSPQDIAAIEAAGLTGFTVYGGNYELSFNISGPVFEGTGKLNPFANPKNREAMTFLVDREFIVDEVYAGAANARYTVMSTTGPEYGRYIDLIRPYEVFYATDRTKAEALFEEGMTEIGAEMVDGKWTYEGEPVELIFLIRTDGDGTRLTIGDFVSNWLEEVGFTVDRQYKTSSEASPLWLLGNMADGLFHIYTGGWGASGLSRDDTWVPQWYCAPSSGMGSYNMWAIYADVMTDEDLAAIDDLSNGNFTTLEERRELFKMAIDACNKYNFRIFLVDQAAVSPRVPELEVSGNLASGIVSNTLSPYTLRFTGEEGGLVRWIEPDLLVDPANPVDGSNWTYDGVWQNPTQSYAMIDHPHTGLYLPMRLERAEVTVQSGLPIGKTYDWLTLETADEITVPGGAWVDWDAETQTWITADEKFPDGLTAVTKTVYYFPEDLFDIVQWHDGSSLSIGDFVMQWIMGFDPAKEASAIYDASTVPAFEAALAAFKGYNIISTDPFVFEYYSDVWYGDAEYIAANINAWPQYGYGEAQWAMLAVSNKTEAKGQLAYGTNKSQETEVEWMNYIGGPSLEFLEEALAEATTETHIPYEPTMGQFVTAEEAAARYANIQAFYEEYGHFWIGTGPYILDDVFLVEKTLTLTHNPNFPDLADRWAGFVTPKVGEVAVDGPGRVTIGEEASFDIFVEFQGEAYPADEVAEVKYILFNASNEVVEVGLAELVTDGQYVVTLSAETTGRLGSGANKMDIVGVYIPVALPSVVTFEFVSE